MANVSEILTAIDQGDPHAAEQLLPLVYEELQPKDEELRRFRSEAEELLGMKKK
jgi:hypothetical protein